MCGPVTIQDEKLSQTLPGLCSFWQGGNFGLICGGYFPGFQYCAQTQVFTPEEPLFKQRFKNTN